jgi:hypothetical protein
LSLDVSSSSDLNLHQAGSESSSEEFELTLDETGGDLAPAEEESALSADDEKDIFETDFEVPALDEESGSEAVALEEADTDLESSDFELELDQEGEAADEESGSQVVPLDEEGEADVAAPTAARPRRRAAAGDEEVPEEDFGADLEGEPEEGEEAPAAVAAAPAPPAEWGAVPVVFLAPCVLVLFLVGLMSFELLQGMWGYHKPAKVGKPLIDPIARMFDDTLPKD